MIQRLRFHRLVEELDADLVDDSVPHDRLEVLVGKGKRRRYRHAGDGGGNDPLQHFVFKHQIAVHQDDVVVQILPGAVDAVDVVRVLVDRILDKREVQREPQAVAIVDEHGVEQTSGHDDVLDARVDQQLQLPGENRFLR